MYSLTPSEEAACIETRIRALRGNTANLLGAIEFVCRPCHAIPIIALHLCPLARNGGYGNTMSTVGVATKKATGITQHKMPLVTIYAGPLTVGDQWMVR